MLLLWRIKVLSCFERFQTVLKFCKHLGFSPTPHPLPTPTTTFVFYPFKKGDNSIRTRHTTLSVLSSVLNVLISHQKMSEKMSFWCVTCPRIPSQNWGFPFCLYICTDDIKINARQNKQKKVLLLSLPPVFLPLFIHLLWTVPPVFNLLPVCIWQKSKPWTKKDKETDLISFCYGGRVCITLVHLKWNTLSCHNFFSPLWNHLLVPGIYMSKELCQYAIQHISWGSESSDFLGEV